MMLLLLPVRVVTKAVEREALAVGRAQQRNISGWHRPRKEQPQVEDKV